MGDLLVELGHERVGGHARRCCTARERGQEARREAEEALLQGRAALQELPGRVQAADASKDWPTSATTGATCCTSSCARRSSRPPAASRRAILPPLWPPASSPVARLSRVASVRRAAAPRSPRDLRRQLRHGVARQHRAHPRAGLRVRAPGRHRAVLRRRAGRLRLPLRLAGVADRLPAAAAAHAQGRLLRHAPRARPGQAAPRALPDRVDVRGLRRPAGASAARVLLGPREPDRAARRLRRGQALRRGADDGLPPPAGRGHGDRADLQHLRPADAPARRPRDPDVHAPGAAGPADHRVRRRVADALVLLTCRT